eukprot:gene32849-43926_t
MFQQIIDRRLAGKNKSIGNRERFLRRHKEQIREAVKRAVDGRSIRDLAQGEDIHIPKRDISEPVFRHGQGGQRDMVHPGNQDYLRGDRIARPKGGGGSGGGGQASDSGEGDDDFVFHLTKEEFMQVFFDDLALPNLARTTLAETPEFKTHRAGYSSDGNPSNLHVVRSMRGAIGRRIAIGSESRRELHQLETHLDHLLSHPDPNPHGGREDTAPFRAVYESPSFPRHNPLRSAPAVSAPQQNTGRTALIYVVATLSVKPEMRAELIAGAQSCSSHLGGNVTTMVQWSGGKAKAASTLLSATG